VWDLLKAEDLPGAGNPDGAAAFRNYLSGIDSISRCLFIFHALWESLQRARQGPEDILLLVGYWYKYAVVEELLGTPPTLLASLTDLFPVPERAIWLDLAPGEAARRKPEFTRYECGGQNPGRDTFQLFQERCRSRLGEIAAEHGFVTISGGGSPEQVRDWLLDALGEERSN
jgi:hypothetical protein